MSILSGILTGAQAALTQEEAEHAADLYLREARIKCTPAATFNSCASITPVMAARLRGLGYAAEQVKMVGLRRKLGPYAHRAWRDMEQRRPYFTHHAVLLGGWVLDPTGVQFGRDFPLVSPAAEYFENWNEAYVLAAGGRVERTIK